MKIKTYNKKPRKEEQGVFIPRKGGSAVEPSRARLQASRRNKRAFSRKRRSSGMSEAAISNAKHEESAASDM